ncbi:MAG: hypothetical protein V7K88_06965 [Nostoc sp.]|uniref:hypothetical protein n=1 Tax=Nostoc sp. TaxID=1180 RepID=UPI002FFA89C2
MPPLVFEAAFHITKRIMPRYPCGINAGNGGRSAVHELNCGEYVVHFYFEA